MNVDAAERKTRRREKAASKRVYSRAKRKLAKKDRRPAPTESPAPRAGSWFDHPRSFLRSSCRFYDTPVVATASGFVWWLRLVPGARWSMHQSIGAWLDGCTAQPRTTVPIDS